MVVSRGQVVKKHTCCSTHIQALDSQKQLKLLIREVCGRLLSFGAIIPYFLHSHPRERFQGLELTVCMIFLPMAAIWNPVPSLPNTRIVGSPGESSFNGTALEETEPPRTRQPLSADETRNCIIFLQYHM